MLHKPLEVGRLSQALYAPSLPWEDIRRRLAAIHQGIMVASRHIGEANFQAIHVSDLDWLFHAYDLDFFNGGLREALGPEPLRFRLSTRMTNAGGKTTTIRPATASARYEIAISLGLLFDAFTEPDELVLVCGLPCATRIEALQRIFEHELVHLSEQLCWQDSNCAAARFQTIASRLFLHRSHRHQMLTRAQRAAAVGIRAGSRVTFLYQGQRLTGRVSRVTTRATVLVADPRGRLFSDGHHYRTFYVPVPTLEPVE